jgi:hypothetical protein
LTGSGADDTIAAIQSEVGMREARGMAAAAAVVMMAVLLGCGGGARDKESAPTASESTPPGQDRDKPAANAQASDQPAANPAGTEDQYDPATAAGAVKGVPAPGNDSQIEAVANYFAELPGVDLAPLGERGKAKFLHRVNSELCSCGCKDQTLAFCLVNDPKCPQVKGLVQSVYDEVKSGR